MAGARLDGWKWPRLIPASPVRALYLQMQEIGRRLDLLDPPARRRRRRVRLRVLTSTSRSRHSSR
ncbi:MAG: hypothetical protein ACYTG6_14115 [Planctomycetota bacterium]|jgi:hypothetical protein